MNIRKITMGVMVALTAAALGTVIATNPFSASASSSDGSDRQVVQSLHVTDGATSTYIGVALVPIPAAEAEQLGIEGGAKVHRVDDAGPSGGLLEPGDVITAVDGQAVASPRAVAEAVHASSVGDTLVFTVLRGGEYLDVSVVAGERVVKRHGPRYAPRATKSKAGHPLLAQIMALGDRFARGELVLAGADGNYQTHSAAVGNVTGSDADAGTFTLQPRDGSDAIDYTISTSTKVRLVRDGDIGALNTTDTTLVIDVDGDVKLVHQGPLQAKKIGPRSHFGKRGHKGPGGLHGRQGPGPRRFPAGAHGFGAGAAGIDLSGLLEGLRLRIGDLGDGGPASLFQALCNGEHMDQLPERIVIRCESQSGSETPPTVGDDAV